MEAPYFGFIQNGLAQFYFALWKEIFHKEQWNDF